MATATGKDVMSTLEPKQAVPDDGAQLDHKIPDDDGALKNARSLFFPLRSS